MADALLEIADQAVGTPAYLDLKLSSSGDMQITGAVYAIRQAVTLRLMASVDDFFLDMDAGVPWLSGLLEGRQGLTPSFEAILQNTVLATPGVLGLVSWETKLNRSARLLNIKFEAQCDGGLVAFSLPIGAPGA